MAEPDQGKTDAGYVQREDSTSSQEKPHEDSTSEQETQREESSSGQAANQISGGGIYDWRFWTVFSMLMLSGAITALDYTIPSVALPTIAADLGAGSSYAWIGGAFGVSSAVVQPLCGQLADIFGRKPVILTAIALFTLGTGLCGGANSIAMLISGRTVQGLGAGGMMVVTDTIFCDMVPLSDRGKYMGMLMALSAVLLAVGPVIGGAIVQHTTWRWVFWLQMPICGITLVSLTIFLKLRHTRDKHWWALVKRIDHTGNAIFSASLVMLLLALNWGGSSNSWGEAKVVTLLVLGAVGLIGFCFFERSKWCKEPMMPTVLYSSRTGAAAILITLLATVLAIWVPYYLTVYFEAVKQKNPGSTGVSLLPQSVSIMPFAMLGGGVLSKFGNYKVMHAIAQGGMALGLGLFALLKENTSTAVWATFQVIFAAFSGFQLASLLPAVQAPLPEKYVASSTALFSFMRSLGGTLGIVISAVIFNSQIDRLVHMIPSEQIQSMMRDGGAYALASQGFISSIPSDLRPSVLTVYTKALRITWFGAMGIALLGFLLVFVERSIPLRTTLDTDYGIDRKEKDEVASKEEV